MAEKISAYRTRDQRLADLTKIQEELRAPEGFDPSLVTRRALQMRRARQQLSDQSELETVELLRQAARRLRTPWLSEAALEQISDALAVTGSATLVLLLLLVIWKRGESGIAMTAWNAIIQSFEWAPLLLLLVGVPILAIVWSFLWRPSNGGHSRYSWFFRHSGGALLGGAAIAAFIMWTSIRQQRTDEKTLRVALAFAGERMGKSAIYSAQTFRETGVLTPCPSPAGFKVQTVSLSRDHFRCTASSDQLPGLIVADVKAGEGSVQWQYGLREHLVRQIIIGRVKSVSKDRLVVIDEKGREHDIHVAFPNLVVQTGHDVAAIVDPHTGTAENVSMF